MADLPQSIELQVVTPERHVLSENVQFVEVPGKDGYMGILPGHAPLLSELGIGLLTYRKGDEAKVLTVIQGYTEVLPDRVVVLAEISERAEEIDVARAETAAEKAKAQLAQAAGKEPDWQNAAFALQRALVRLQAANKGPAHSA
jgi:F-type H+-transporting ATPase subunit epsilon